MAFHFMSFGHLEDCLLQVTTRSAPNQLALGRWVKPQSTQTDGENKQTNIQIKKQPIFKDQVSEDICYGKSSIRTEGEILRNCISPVNVC